MLKGRSHVVGDILNRPPLKSNLAATEFSSWYWLKEELVTFCRAAGISSSGSKLELQERILAHLSGLPSQAKLQQKRRSGNMPSTFSLQTVIGPGWRCNPSLGAFFRQACSEGFHFNAPMRDFIHNGAGQTLADAAICYHASRQPGSKLRSIPKQLEYNQHFRDYFRDHPGASRQEAIDAWWNLRGRRKPPSKRDPA